MTRPVSLRRRTFASPKNLHLFLSITSRAGSRHRGMAKKCPKIQVILILCNAATPPSLTGSHPRAEHSARSTTVRQVARCAPHCQVQISRLFSPPFLPSSTVDFSTTVHTVCNCTNCTCTYYIHHAAAIQRHTTADPQADSNAGLHTGKRVSVFHRKF